MNREVSITEKPMRGPWSVSQLQQYLYDCETPLRIACQAADGYPLIVPLWFCFDGQSLWSATHCNAKVVKCLKRNPNVGFELANNEMPYKGVRGKADVVLHSDKGSDVLDQVMKKYIKQPGSHLEKWLSGRKEEEIAIELIPHSFSVWDYSARMQGAY